VDGDRDSFRAEISKTHPEYSSQQIGSAAGQLWNFIRTMKVGDYVVIPARSAGQVLVGQVTGGYIYDPNFDTRLPRTRAVKWFSTLQWRTLPQNFLDSLSFRQTIVQPGIDFQPVIKSAESPDQATNILDPIGRSAEASKREFENLEGRAEKAVREKLLSMNHVDFQLFVGALFKAAGFTELENSAGSGADDGIDIILAKDRLGVGERVIVQVKHTIDKVSQPDFQKLLGTLKSNEHGLVVSSGGFSGPAYKCWLENRDKLLKPMDADGLIQMLQQHYEKLQDEEKELLPLKRVLVPISSNDDED
jgi:restriction system protein